MGDPVVADEGSYILIMITVKSLHQWFIILKFFLLSKSAKSIFDNLGHLKYIPSGVVEELR